jgi:hypothetical protein
MLLFLIIPVAFKRLKRFKFFNMEFEVDSFIEQAAIETVEISGNKAQLMTYLTKTQIIKERAARKLGESKKVSSIKQTSQIRVTGSMVKPIHVSKSDPLVKE